MAVNCLVRPATTVGLAGVTEMDTRLRERGGEYQWPHPAIKTAGSNVTNHSLLNSLNNSDLHIFVPSSIFFSFDYAFNSAYIMVVLFTHAVRIR